MDNKARIEIVLSERSAGKTYAEIAQNIGVSSTRVRQILHKQIVAPTAGFEGLNRKLVNVLAELKITTLVELNDAVKSGEIRDMPNIGAKSVEILRDFLSKQAQKPI